VEHAEQLYHHVGEGGVDFFNLYKHHIMVMNGIPDTEADEVIDRYRDAYGEGG
jgi:hypothetical protein